MNLSPANYTLIRFLTGRTKASIRRAYSPPFKGGVAAPSRKCCEATLEGADGVVGRAPCFKTHSAMSLVSDHPGRAITEWILFLNGPATPPFQGGTWRLAICARLGELPS